MDDKPPKPPITNDGASVQGVAPAPLWSYSEELTEQKCAEDELRRSEAFYRAIFENTGSASILIGPDTSILLANSEWYRLTGYGAEDIQNGMSWQAVAADEDLPRMQNYHYNRRQGRGEAPSDYEFRLLRKDGSIKHVSLRVAMIPGTDISIASQHDVTDRKLAEEKFRLAFYSSPTPMTISEAGGGSYVEVNQAALDGVGYTLEEMTGKTRQELGIYTDEAIQEISRQLQANGRITNLETSLRHKNGQNINVIVNCDLVEINGKSHVLSSTIDITERKQMEQALQESEEKFRLFAENALDGFAIIVERRYVYVNPALCTMLGYSEEELLEFQDIAASMADTPLGKDLIMQKYAHRLQGNVANEPYEAQLLHQDGHTVIDVVLSPASVTVHGEVHVFMLIRNNTAQKKAERERAEALAAMQASEERYRSLFWHTPAGVVNYDQDLIVTESNERFLDIIETDRDRLIGLDLKKVRDPGILPAIQATLQGREGLYEGYYQATSSDVQKWIVLHTAPVYLSDGSPAGGVAITEDISSRREAEMERDRLRHLLENTFDSMPSILVGIDAERRITQWNREAMLRTGLNHMEAQGRLIEEVLPLVAPLIASINAALEDQSVMSEERLNYYENEEACFARVIIYPLVGGEDRGAVVRLDDVTEMVRLEEMMIQTEKMMSVGGMAAGMAHEINNPLGGILQGSQNILRRLDAHSTLNRQVAEKCGANISSIRKYVEEREILTFLEGIRSSGVRASSIVSNMLQFSRASGAQKEYADLAALAERTIELAGSEYDLKKGYDFRHINIIRDFDENLPHILCSPVEIEQVVLNLLKNAAQAMAGQNDRQYISLRTRLEGEWAVLEVADNGPGMDENTRRRVFEPFFTTKPTGLGTGLGLAVSYFIITNNHHGQIFVESQPGRGTAFTIRLPLSL